MVRNVDAGSLDTALQFLSAYCSWHTVTVTILQVVRFGTYIAPVSYTHLDVYKRQELRSLEHQANENKEKGEEVKTLIAQLEKSIAAYKEEYAQLISQEMCIRDRLKTI